MRLPALQPPVLLETAAALPHARGLSPARSTTARHQWVDVKDLRPGDMLRTSAGTFIKVVKTTKRTVRQRMHNLTVDDLHTYYVIAGSTDVLVRTVISKV
jgi:pretoxin HINT domain-containing protein